MDKQEFTLQAALTLLKASPETPATLIASTAKVLADELFGKPAVVENPAVITSDDINDSVAKEDISVIVEEVVRIDESARRELLAKGCHIQPRTAARVANACAKADIKSVGDLLAIGRKAFKRLPRVGDDTVDNVSDALFNLYGISRW